MNRGFRMTALLENISEIMQQTGIIFDLKKYAIHDGPGIRTTVFMKGCPLDCWWCHNPESIKMQPEWLNTTNHKYLELLSNDDPFLIGKKVSSDDVLKELEKDIIFFDESGGGVTFSGGEPLMQADFLDSLLAGCREREIHTAVDTSGYAPWDSFEKILDKTALFLFDLKMIDNEQHKKYTGVSNALILENLTKLIETNTKIQIRIPLIPGYTASENNLAQTAEYLAGFRKKLQVSLLPYNPIGEEKYKRFEIKSRVKNIKKQSIDEFNSDLEIFTNLDAEVWLDGDHE